MRRLAPSRRTAVAVTSRIVAAVGAGYACTAAVVALAGLLLPLAFGMARSEAVVLAAMSGFVLYLVALLWGFGEPSLVRVWSVFAGGAALCWGLAHWLAPLLALRAGTAG